MSVEENNRKKRNISDMTWICLIGLGCICLAYCVVAIFIRERALHPIYMKMLFLPVASFVSGFFSYVKTHKFIQIAIITAAENILFYFLFISFSVNALLWVAVYLLNTLVGSIIAFLTISES